MAKKRKKQKRIFNCIGSRKTEKDWVFESAAGARAAQTNIPISKDLRATWWKIANQEQTGSCVGWATGDSVLRWHFVKKGLLKKEQLLSVRYLWMASKETDTDVNYATTFLEGAGTSIKTALDIARKFGTVQESVLPFGGSLSPLDEDVFYAKAANGKIASYYNLIKGDKLANYRNWIANNGPIAVRLECDSTWDAIGSDGVLDEYDRDSAGPEDGHAVALVGYTKNHFIVRNSWGTNWGDKGFAYATNAYTAAAFDEAYGVIP
jgi:C1A family cysteine protease